MKRLSIKMAIVLPVLAVLTLGITVMVIILGTSASASTGDLSNRIIDARVNEFTNQFLDIGNAGYASVEAMTPVVQGLAETSADPRQRIVDTFISFMESTDNVLAVWTCWEPNALDGLDAQYVNANEYHDATGRYVPYVYKENGRVFAEPLSGYNDPVEGLFYQGARSSGRPYITDPYEYVAGSVTHTIYSIAIPIIKDGYFVGAVGIWI